MLIAKYYVQAKNLEGLKQGIDDKLDTMLARADYADAYSCKNLAYKQPWGCGGGGGTHIIWEPGKWISSGPAWSTQRVQVSQSNVETMPQKKQIKDSDSGLRG